MPLPSSGAINFAAINTELGAATNTTRALGSAAVRGLYGVASGAIRLAADGYGKSNFWKGSLIKGFTMGGRISPAPGANSLTAEKYTYSTQTGAVTPAASLSIAIGLSSGMGNTEKGFTGGGELIGTPVVATSHKTTLSSETTVVAPGVIPARRGILSAGNSTKGFFTGGGTTPATPVSERVTYSTETKAAVPTANMVAARYEGVGVGNDTKGFYTGGRSPGLVATAATERNTFATETNASVPGANLSVARYGLGGFGNPDSAYFATGLTPPNSPRTTVDKTSFSTETTAATPLSVTAKLHVSYLGDGTRGFLLQGLSPGPTFNTSVQNILYSNDTVSSSPAAAGPGRDRAYSF
jgi:hypothetical protein